MIEGVVTDGPDEIASFRLDGREMSITFHNEFRPAEIVLRACTDQGKYLKFIPKKVF